MKIKHMSLIFINKIGQFDLRIFKNHLMTKDENIGNHGYIGTSILRIYRRYIDGYFEKKISINLKLIKIYKNIRKTS